MNNILKFLAFSLLSNFTLADCNSDFCFSVYIDRLYVKDDGSVYIGTNGDESKLTCSANGGGTYLKISSGNLGLNNMYSALLAAQLSGKQLNSIQVTDVSGESCEVQYITLDRT